MLATTKTDTNPASPLVVPSKEAATANRSPSGSGSASRRWSPVSTRTGCPRAATRAWAASTATGSPGGPVSATASIRPPASRAATAPVA